MEANRADSDFSFFEKAVDGLALGSKREAFQCIVRLILNGFVIEAEAFRFEAGKNMVVVENRVWKYSAFYLHITLTSLPK